MCVTQEFEAQLNNTQQQHKLLTNAATALDQVPGADAQELHACICRSSYIHTAHIFWAWEPCHTRCSAHLTAQHASTPVPCVLSPPTLQRGDLVTVPPQEIIGQQPGNYKKNYKKVRDTRGPCRWRAGQWKSGSSSKLNGSSSQTWAGLDSRKSGVCSHHVLHLCKPAQTLCALSLNVCMMNTTLTCCTHADSMHVLAERHVHEGRSVRVPASV